MTVIPQMLENQIALLKECLKFYGDDKNHIKNDENGKSLVDSDKGFLAKETLKNVQRLEEQNKEFSDQFDALTVTQTTPEALLAEIQKIADQTK